MLWDMAGHVPSASRSVLPSGVQMALALHLDQGEFESSWEEIRRSELERRIEGELERRIPPNAPIVRVAEPTGEWLAILRLLYSIVRVTKPQNVVETGVGVVGATTTFILEAMRLNGTGHLWSIDDNRFQPIYGINVGNGIPDDLRGRHTLVVGRTRQWLEPLLRQCAPVDIFLHDGEHTFENMLYEYSTAWTYLRSSGILLTDDAGNNSIDVFSRRVNRTPLFVAYGPTHFGALRR
ncbi:MAG: class I SAM-dependent methyltransferase [Candidatus Lutacidiplasmatales archaeon]